MEITETPITCLSCLYFLTSRGVNTRRIGTTPVPGVCQKDVIGGVFNGNIPIPTGCGHYFSRRQKRMENSKKKMPKKPKAN